MGGSFSVLLNQVPHWVYVKWICVYNLEENIVALEAAIEELKAKRDDLSRKVDIEENKGLRRLAQVQVWIINVDTLENRVNAHLSTKDVELERLSLYGICSSSLISSYGYGKRVFKMLEDVINLKSIGYFEMVAVEAQASKVVKRSIQQPVVGQEKMLETVWNHLKEDNVGTIGLYGMGGVGKTTLLKQINNEFAKHENGFDVVIWIVVSREFPIKKILEGIGKKLGLVSEEWNQHDKDEKAFAIYNVLERMKFLLLLDDIWEKVNLINIGVPFPNRENRSKLVFTTCSQDVCGCMGADVFKEVRCLEHQDALHLFCKKAGNITCERDPRLFDFANMIVEKCQGLPLSLNVIGETMASKHAIQEWQHAISVLDSYGGMEDDIFSVLKYSYDYLIGEDLKSSLLYCSIYPKNYRFRIEDLIERLIGEGVIDANEGLRNAVNKGYDIIFSLIRASLLM